MPTRITHRLGDEFDERNPFLNVTLGVISLCQRLEAFLARYGSGPTTASGEADDDPARYAVLGLVSLSRTAMSGLESALRGAPGRTAHEGRARRRVRHPRAPRDLLV